jgi:hypothetical protein
MKRCVIGNFSCGLLISLLCLCGAASAYAQRTDFQSWTLVTAQAILDADKKWLLYAEAQPRIGNDVSRLERLLLRPALGYNYSTSTTFYLGGAWTPTFYDTHALQRGLP